MTKNKLQQKITEMIRESEKRCSNDHDEEIKERPLKYLKPHMIKTDPKTDVLLFDNANELDQKEIDTLKEFCIEELEKEAKKTDIDYQKVFYLSHIMELNRSELDKLTPSIKKDLLDKIAYYDKAFKRAIPKFRRFPTKKTDLLSDKHAIYCILCELFGFSIKIEKSDTYPLTHCIIKN